MFIFTFGYYFSVQLKKSLKMFSSLMYLVSIYAIVFQLIFKVNYNANLKTNSINQKKIEDRPWQKVSLSHQDWVEGDSKYLPLIVVLETSNIGILEVCQKSTVWPTPGLLNQNIHCNEITRRSVRTFKFGNDVYIVVSQPRCPFESLKSLKKYQLLGSIFKYSDLPNVECAIKNV